MYGQFARACHHSPCVTVLCCNVWLYSLYTSGMNERHGEMNSQSVSACFLEVSNDRLLRKLDIEDVLLSQKHE